MFRPLTPWETEIIDRLEEAAKAESLGLKALAARLGLQYDMVYRMIQREQGIGPRTLEALRLAEPLIVAEAFVPEGYALVPTDLEGMAVFLSREGTTVQGEAGAGGQEGEP